MGRKKIQKKINKKRIIAKRKPTKQVQRKPTADQTTRMNEMLKVALVRQQPNIMTSDPNTLATNKKIEELDSKRQKQIDALTDRLATKEREAAAVQGERMHQEQVNDLQRKIKATDKAIEAEEQKKKSNKRYNELTDLREQTAKRNSELLAIREITNSEDFQKPLLNFMDAYKNAELKRMELENQKAVFELMQRNREEEAKLYAVAQANSEFTEVKRPRYDKRFVMRDNNGHRIAENLTEAQNGEIKNGRKVFVVVNGKHSAPKQPITLDQTTHKYKDADGREVFTFKYANNQKTDLELYQIQLQEEEERNRELKRSLKSSKAIVDEIEGIKDRMLDLNIENNKLVNELRLTDGYVYKYNKDNGKPTQNLIDLYEAVTDASHERARNEAQLDYAKEKVAAHKAELEAHKQKEYTKAMRDAFNSETYQAQRKEIADAQNRANLARMAKEEAQKDIDLQKSLAEQEGQKQLLQLSIKQGGFNPEVIAQAQTQIASQARAAVGNPELLDAIGRFNTQYKQLDSIPQQMVDRILERTGIETNAIHHPESYNYELHPSYFKAATQIVNDVAAWSQQDPYDPNTVNSDYFVNNYEINLSNF